MIRSVIKSFTNIELNELNGEQLNSLTHAMIHRARNVWKPRPMVSMLVRCLPSCSIPINNLKDRPDTYRARMAGEYAVCRGT